MWHDSLLKHHKILPTALRVILKSRPRTVVSHSAVSEDVYSNLGVAYDFVTVTDQNSIQYVTDITVNRPDLLISSDQIWDPNHVSIAGLGQFEQFFEEYVPSSHPITTGGQIFGSATSITQYPAIPSDPPLFSGDLLNCTGPT